MNWKPIETAPKDGTPLLAWDGDVFVAYYDVSVNYRGQECKILIDKRRGEWAGSRPTHWMPLPQPPTTEAE